MNVLDAATALDALIETHGKTLLDVAERSIRHGLAQCKPLPVRASDYPSALSETGASFVTLHRAGELRGCVGSAQPWRALIVDVAENAFASAFDDPRFPSIRAEEADEIDIELSLLGPAEPFPVSSEAGLIAALRPGRDGLILGDGARRALFLPAVWDTIADPAAFVAHLKDKAGIAQWSPRVAAQRFETRTVARKPGR